MRRYNLKCPHCGEDGVYISASNPSDLHCIECEEEIDAKTAIMSAIGWIQYAIDLNATLATRNRIHIPQDVVEVGDGTRSVDLE